MCLSPASGRSPGEGNGNPLQYSCLGTAHGQRSLMGYSPRGPRVGHNWATNTFTLNEQPPGKGRHRITSARPPAFTASASPMLWGHPPWGQRHEMKRSNDCLLPCAVSPQVSTSVSFSQNDVRPSQLLLQSGSQRPASGGACPAPSSRSRAEARSRSGTKWTSEFSTLRGHLHLPRGGGCPSADRPSATTASPPSHLRGVWGVKHLWNTPRSRGAVSRIKTNKWGFPGGPLGKHSPVSASLVWEDPTCCGATKPECYNYWIRCADSPLHAPQQQKKEPGNEKPWHSQELESSSLSQQLDKAWMQQQRPSTAKNKIKIKTKINK